ncbi:MAG: TIGR00730 family Rossman fold protein [Coxiellaceae bacterium]|nr:TIGR00730 family Rossman fold protein [Coxiellaceae bacterium]
MNKLKKIAVFCGSSTGTRPEYANAAEQLALSLCQHGISLVYGGASVGIMGILADSMLKHGGEAIGVIPKSMVDIEISHQSLTELFVVDTMHERKALMADMSDGFILLPGGAGSLDEFFEILTWLQLGYHIKPCAILNTSGYYDPLLHFIDHAIKEGFMKQAHREATLVETSPENLVSSLFDFAPELGEKWINDTANISS